MTTKAKVMKRLAEIGATLDGPHHHPYDGWHGNIEAPAGFVWFASDTHNNCGPEFGFPTKAKFWEAVWIEIDSGLSPCVDPTCEHCHTVDED